MKSNKQSKKVFFLVHAAAIAALYVVLTQVSATFDLASGVVQARLSECLTVLPFFTPAAVPGLTIGCILANVLSPQPNVYDIVFGSLATLLGAIGSYLLRKNRYLCSLSPVVANTLIIPFVLKFAFAETVPIWLMMITVAVGEIITCVVLGQILISALQPVHKHIFSGEDSFASKRFSNTDSNIGSSIDSDTDSKSALDKDKKDE